MFLRASITLLPCDVISTGTLPRRRLIPAAAGVLERGMWLKPAQGGSGFKEIARRKARFADER